MSKLVLLDTFNFLHRAYHALPKTFTDGEGNPVNAVYGVTSMIITVLDVLKPSYIAAAADGMKPTFRVEEYTAYKAHRKPMDVELSSQIPKVFEVINSFGIPLLQVDGYEADDVIATLATRYSGQETHLSPNDILDVVMVSNDRDLWQLLGEHTMVMVPDNKGSSEWVGHKEAEARLGFDPQKIAEYKGFRGDPSDNLPGIHGVGEVSAAKLLAKYETVEDVYAHIDEVTPASLREKLLSGYEEAIKCRNLAKLIKDVPLDIELSRCKYSDFNRNDVKKVLEKYRFKSLIKRLGFETSSDFVKKTDIVSDKQPSLF